jgi:hypothetical protein
MAKRETIRRFDFTVDVDGKVYNCRRDVTGVRVLRQLVYVVGIGSKADGASYDSIRASTMEGIARIIAGEIIRQNPTGE